MDWNELEWIGMDWNVVVLGFEKVIVKIDLNLIDYYKL
jgi:hypothetical protein